MTQEINVGDVVRVTDPLSPAWSGAVCVVRRVRDTSYTWPIYVERLVDGRTGSFNRREVEKHIDE